MILSLPFHQTPGPIEHSISSTYTHTHTHPLFLFHSLAVVQSVGFGLCYCSMYLRRVFVLRLRTVARFDSQLIFNETLSKWTTHKLPLATMYTCSTAGNGKMCFAFAMMIFVSSQQPREKWTSLTFVVCPILKSMTCNFSIDFPQFVVEMMQVLR